MNTDEIRRSFQPDKIVILFVGESPPANGTFFYCANSQAFNYMQKAFSCVLEVGHADFLTQFKALGCYLDDLALAPINKLPSRDKKRACEEGVRSLAERIGCFSPRHVVAIKKSIWTEVEEAVQLSGTKATFHGVPFPGTGWQTEFVKEMAVLLPRLLGARQCPNR